jgi:hypothetical protein
MLAMSKLRIIVSGLVGQYPLGGVAWDYFHYALGLHELGHDVYYDESTNMWPYDPVRQQPSDDGNGPARFIGEFLSRYCPEMAQKWHYCLLLKDHFGMSHEAFGEVAATADIYLNVSGANIFPDRLNPRCLKVFMDTDPGLVQFGLHDSLQGDHRRYKEVAQHDRFLTYAENIHAADCRLPRVNLPWITTRPIATLAHWASARAQRPKDTALTTVMTLNFMKDKKPFHHDGVDYFDKRVEFDKFLDLPARSRLPLRLATGEMMGEAEVRQRGWQIIPAYSVSATPEAYRQFIADSAGEWSIAKNFYVATRSGWFSCRTACYLAAGRPAVVQDTAWSRYVPSGRGVHAFSTMEEAAAAIDRIATSPQAEAQAAFEIARDYLSPQAVLAPMLEQIAAASPATPGQ